jgi:sporulation protein YlmC with PRC-barrel domain
MKKIIIFAVAALLSAGQAFAGGQNHFGTNRMSQLMDMDVKSSNGEEIGEVSDVILDQNGNVSYIVVSQGGVLGMGDRLIPIPVSAFQKGDGKDVILNIDLSTDRSRLDSAPYFTSNQWPNFEDRTWDQQVRGYYKSAGAESNSPGVSGSGSLGRSPSGNIGTSSGAAK